MRAILLLLSLVVGVSVAAQQPIGMDECKSMYEHGRKEELMPVLEKNWEDLSCEDAWDEEKFIGTVVLFGRLYTDSGDLRSFHDLCHDAITLHQQRTSCANNENSRLLWKLSATCETHLCNFQQAIHQGELVQTMYESESIYDQGYFSILLLIGNAYMSLGDWPSASLYYDEALNMHLAYLGPIEDSHLPDSYILLISLGDVELKSGDVLKAESFYKQVINSDTSDSVLDDVRFMATNSLANLYTYLGRYHEAASLYSSISPQLPVDNYRIHQNWAICSLMSGDTNKASVHIGLSNRAALNYLNQMMSDFAEAEREKLWEKVSDQMACCNNMIACVSITPKDLTEAFEINSFTRDFNISFARLVKEALLANKDSCTIEMWRNYCEMKGRLTYDHEEDSIRNNIISDYFSLEKDILSVAHIDLPSYFHSHYNSARLIHELNEDEILFDMVYINIPSLAEEKGVTSERWIYAYVLTSESRHPDLIPICEEGRIYPFIEASFDMEALNSMYSEAGGGLYELLVHPLLQRIGNHKKVKIRPIGLTSPFNIAAIKDPDGNLIGDIYDIQLVSDLFGKSNNQKMNLTKIALFGDADFNTPITKTDNPTVNVQNLALRGFWGPIPATRIEIDAIEESATALGIPSVKYFGKDASEAEIKLLDGVSPSILHIATHGYFIGSGEEASTNVFLSKVSGTSGTSYSQLHFGLLFSGANDVWNGPTFPNSEDDGVLTGDEISRMDLDGTDLVVLSGCSTGKGFLSGTDGAQGLIRAFQDAGVQTVIASLWEVPDDSTALLMKKFYEHILNGVSIREALRLSQRYIQSLGYTDPFYWASFIVMN